jgi:hypothetical protein
MITTETSKDISERTSLDADEMKQFKDFKDCFDPNALSEKISDTVSFEKLSDEKGSVIDQGKNFTQVRENLLKFFIKNYTFSKYNNLK